MNPEKRRQRAVRGWTQKHSEDFNAPINRAGRRALMHGKLTCPECGTSVRGFLLADHYNLIHKLLVKSV